MNHHEHFLRTFISISVRIDVGKVNTVYNPVPSDRFNELDPEELSTMDWNEDTLELLLDYRMFHRWYEVKIIKNKLVKQANDAKKTENEAIREKQRKEHKRKQHEMERLQKRVPKGFKVCEEAKVNRLTALASSLNAAI